MEAFGEYTYGDIKGKSLVGFPSYGIYDNIPTSTKNLSYQLSTVISKVTSCYSYSLNKSTNILYNYIDNSEAGTGGSYEILDYDQYKVITPEKGYYDIQTVGQVMMHTLTIIPGQEGSVVKINNEERTTYIAYDTEEVYYEVSCEGYATTRKTLIMRESTTLNIVLRLPVVLTINPTPEDAVIKINGIEGNSLPIPPDEDIEYEVSKDEYQTVTGIANISEDTIIDVTLKPMEYEVNYPQEVLPKNVVTSGIGDSTSYAYYNTGTQLYSASGSYHVSSGKSYGYIKFTTPDHTTTLTVKCYVSSEANYDFGAVIIGTKVATPTQSNMKSGTSISGCSYMYRNSGNLSESTVTKTLDANTTYYLSFAYAKDGSGNSYSDRLFINNIKFTCI